MSVIDLMAERYILDAQRKGEFDNLPGAGQPLQLDDDSQIPPELRAGYRLLKNAGYLPPEVEMRRTAVELNDLLNSVDPENESYQQLQGQLRRLELALQQAGISTDFLRGRYAGSLQQHFHEEP